MRSCIKLSYNNWLLHDKCNGKDGYFAVHDAGSGVGRREACLLVYILLGQTGVKGKVMSFAVDVGGMGRKEAYVFWCKLMEL